VEDELRSLLVQLQATTTDPKLRHFTANILPNIKQKNIVEVFLVICLVMFYLFIFVGPLFTFIY